MDGHAPPSHSGPTQFPTTFIPEPSSPSLSLFSQPPPSLFRPLSPSSFPGNCPPVRMAAVPPMHNSSAGGSGGGLPASVMSMPPLPTSSPALRRHPSSSVVNKDTASKPPGSSVNIAPRLKSLFAQNNCISSKPSEMAIGVGSQKRGAENEIAPPRRRRRYVSRNGNNDAPPQGVPADVGNDNAPYGGLFTKQQLEKIAASKELIKKAETDPHDLKRRLLNQESAARSKKRKVDHAAFLEHRVKTLEIQNHALIAERDHWKRERMEMGDVCERLRIRLQGWEEQAPIHDALIKQLTEETHRIREEMNEYRRRESERERESERLFEQLNIDLGFQGKPQTNHNFE